MNTTDRPPDAVIEHFGPATHGLTWHRGPEGFSGAVVWRGADPTGTPRVALKGWPHGTTPERVRQVHFWLAQAAHLAFVPTVFAHPSGETTVRADGRVWDGCRWMPGDPRPAPTLADVCSACEAVAQLHLAWPAEPAKQHCRGVAARLEMLRAARPLLESDSRTLPQVAPELDGLLRRALHAAARVVGPAEGTLLPWANVPFSARPCVRDLRGEHVLFQGARVSGVIDYGALALDNPAVDLARLLTDFAGADPALFGAGLRAYRAAGGPLDAPDALVRVLARTGALCSVLGWLIRFLVRREPVTRAAPTAARLAALVTRIENGLHF